MVSVPRVSMISPIVREYVPQAASIASAKVDPEETLNLLYKTLPIGTERKLENFDGVRKISVFRGDGFMNKITQRLKEPCITFIRAMQNAGISENPRMVTKSIVLDVPNKKDALEIYYNVPGDSMQGVFINLYRTDLVTTVKRFANLAELRKDPDVLRAIELWTKKST